MKDKRDVKRVESGGSRGSRGVSVGEQHGLGKIGSRVECRLDGAFGAKTTCVNSTRYSTVIYH